MARILVIEDEEKIARFIELELQHEGYETGKAHDGRTGLDMAESDGYDLVLLDIMLPQLNGLEVLRRLRKTSDVPVIMLTARDAVMDKVSGLDMGADDYVTKPFAIEELLARVRVTLRKRREKTPGDVHVLSAAGVVMNVSSHAVTCRGEEIALTNKEFSLLEMLLSNKNIVLSRDTLLARVWSYDYIGETNVVDVYVRYLRQKIDDRFGIKLIHTVRGVGYMIKDETQ
ncbi:MAG: response regulator transcription factor [Clostridiales bacterium]|nr:response regulator transcription factor [Clostridiales bacterium]